MSSNKILKFLNDNIVMLTGIPLIIGVHWGWSKLQDVPYLVKPQDKKEIPIVAALKGIYGTLSGDKAPDKAD